MILINKDCAIKCSKIFTKDFIPHIISFIRRGCGKYTFVKVL